MSKVFRSCKNFMKSIGKGRGITFADYKKSCHRKQKRKKQERKNYLKAKSMLSQGRESVVVGNAVYYWGKDKKSIIALEPDFDGMRRVAEMIKKRNSMEDSNVRIL